MGNKHSDSQLRYDKENTRRICLKFNNRTDADILQALSTVESMQGYIKNLIRADLAKEAEEDDIQQRV